jgi:hypothetical protein
MAKTGVYRRENEMKIMNGIEVDMGVVVLGFEGDLATMIIDFGMGDHRVCEFDENAGRWETTKLSWSESNLLILASHGFSPLSIEICHVDSNVDDRDSAIYEPGVMEGSGLTMEADEGYGVDDDADDETWM